MPRGGRRAGTPGRAYANRTDLNSTRALPVQAGPSQQYGQAAAQIRSQQAVPMARTPTPPTPTGPPAASPSRGPLVALDAPTGRPSEPITAGAALGPGPGMEAIAGYGDSELDEIRALYARFPSNELRSIIEELESGD